MGERDHNPSAQLKKQKKSLKIGTFNIRSLGSENRYIELIYSLQKIEIDILGLAEVRRIGCNIEEHEDYIFCYKGETLGLHGVGFLVKKEHKTKILNFSGLSERVAMLQMKYNNETLTIIQAYAPTERAPEEDIDSFYKILETALNQAGKRVLLIGDFNAQVGQTSKNESLVMGPFGYGKRSNRGEKLVQYALENKLSIMNTFFKTRKNRKWTWLSPDGKTKNEVDFILSNQPKKIRNVEVLHGLGFRSDHRLVRATYMLEEEKKSRKTFKSQPKSLKTTEDINCYLKNLKLNIDELNTQNDEYDVQTFYNILENIINKSMPSKQKESKVGTVGKIISKQTLDMLTKRTELVKTKQKTKEMKKELSVLYKATSKAIRKDYQNYRNKIIEDKLRKHRSSKRAYKQLTTHKNWIQNLETNTKDTKTRDDVINCATEFYKKLYEVQTDISHSISTTTYSCTNNKLYENIPEEVDIIPIDAMEMSIHIQKLKQDKSPGPDGLQNEALKIGSALLVHPLTYLFNKVLDTGQVPEQWKKSDIILLYKKGNPKNIGNYRPISLLSSVYKLFTSILQSRMTPKIDDCQPIEQAGFRSGFSTTDHMHVTQQIVEKYKEFNRPLYIAFIDYAKAFDTISHNSIWKALDTCHIHDKYIKVLKNIYHGSTSRVKLERRGANIPICRGVRQGDPLSPKLFIAVLQLIFDKLDWSSNGINVNGKRLTHLRFADDIVLFSETSQNLEEMINSLNEESEKVGLKMNQDKTKVMTNSNTNEISLYRNKPLEYVTSYIYLGKLVSFRDSNIEEEVERRVNMSWKKFWSLKEILKGCFPLHLKKTVMDTCILPTLTYGCQTWTYNNKIKLKLATCQKAMERSIMKIRKIQKIRSEHIRKKTKLIDALKYALAQKWRWTGHLARFTDQRWTLETTTWKGPTGKRKRGRPKNRWIDEIITTTGKEWRTKANNRETWSKLEEAYTQCGVPIT